MDVHLGVINYKETSENDYYENQDGGYFEGREVIWNWNEHMEDFWNSWKILFLDLGLGYKSVCLITTHWGICLFCIAF